MMELEIGLILAALLVALIICAICLRLGTAPRVVIDLPSGYENDERGAAISGGAGLTPLSVPAMRSCAQLELPNSREGGPM